VTFVLLQDGKKAKCQASLDDLRYYLATITDKPANQLPPTEDAFEMASPVGNGWRISESRELHPVYYTKE